MPRIGRWALNIVSALSILLCVAVIVFWIRGQYKADWFQWSKTDPQANIWRGHDLSNGRSGVYLSWQWFSFDRPGHAEEYAKLVQRPGGFGHMTSDPQSMPYKGTFWNRLGFGSHGAGVISDHSGTMQDPSYYRYTFDGCHIPYWFLLLLFGVASLPVLLHIRNHRRRARRIRLGQCIACGYDLRATTQRCPECGHDATAQKSTYLNNSLASR